MSTPAGWYPTPDGRQRYWDGEAWTEHFAPTAGSPQVASSGQPYQLDPMGKRRKTNRIVLSVVGGVVGLVLLLVVVGAIAGGGENEASDTAGDAETSTSSADEASDEPNPFSTPTPTTPPAPPPTTAAAAPKKPTDVAADAIRSLDREVNLSSIALNRDQPRSMTVRFKVKDNLTEGTIRTGIGEDAFAVAEGALESGVPFRVLWIQGTFPTTNKFGETTDDSQIFQVRFTRTTLDRLNFDDIVATSYDNMDDLAIGGSFFLLPDLRE